jgi:hypothetical protein
MSLSTEALERFTAYVEHTDKSNTNPDDDTELLELIAWALVHEPDALNARFVLQGVMSEHGLTDNKMRYVQTIMRAAELLVAAYERERGQRPFG